MNAVDGIPYSEGATNLLAGLELAVDEINRYSVHKLNLVSEYLSYSTSGVESVSDGSW